MDFAKKTVLITGGSRGIGRATAIAFASRGASVYFTFQENERAAKDTIEAIEKLGGPIATAVRTDVTNEDGIATLVDDIVRNHGNLDIAVASAGVWPRRPVEQMSMEEFDATMRINMTGTFLLAKHAVRAMHPTRGGAIVFISSTAGQRGEANHAHYAASKGAQISFTKSLAAELAPKYIRVNCVAPGWVDTDMTRSTLQKHAEQIQSVIPLGRPAQPPEIANAVVFLASDLASYITGEILNVNGGAVLIG